MAVEPLAVCYSALAEGTVRVGQHLDSEQIKPFAGIIQLFADKRPHSAFPARIAKQALFRGM